MNNPAAEWLGRAVAEHQRGDLAAAQASIDEALKLDPADARALLVAAHVAEDRGAWDEAATHFRRATEA